MSPRSWIWVLDPKHTVLLVVVQLESHGNQTLSQFSKKISPLGLHMVLKQYCDRHTHHSSG